MNIMERFYHEVHDINSRLRLLHLDMMESNTFDKEELEMIENYLSHTSIVANKIIDIANSKI